MFDLNSKNAFRQSRLFKKGDLKYVILDIIKDNPSHGYDITAFMEDRFHGLYSPSAGSIYPILQSLETMKYVTSCWKDGKNTFTITETGIQFLNERKETTEEIKKRFRGLWGMENSQYFRDIRLLLTYSSEIRHIIGRAAISKDTAKIESIKIIMRDAYNEIRNIEEGLSS